MDDFQREKHELVIVQQYVDLFQRSQKYFAGLRELPQFGSKRLWQPYFQKTFDTYTQLWKYQADHRTVLEKKERYGLKRSEIGDIAAKIAQLYYHYYLRTSEPRYLNESVVFYEAVRSRKYFDQITKDNAALWNKKLRYYARFIVVCLLQNKRDLVEDLLRELREHVINGPSSQNENNEWYLVISELESFVKADTVITVGGNIDTLSYRVKPSVYTPQYDNPIVLSEVILVGHRRKQVKFSELTLDMFRLMQSVEFQQSSDKRLPNKLKNPHKNMLYRPGYSEIMTVLSSALSETENVDNSAVLFYISADSFKDGLLLNQKRRPLPVLSSPSPSPSSATSSPTSLFPMGTFADTNCLTIEDILPFTRKPFFMIVESDYPGSLIPDNFRSRFGMPFTCLMSPRATLPTHLQHPLKTGSLFTYYLSSPIAAFAFTHGFKNIPSLIFDSLLGHLSQQYNKILDHLFRNNQLDLSLKVFLDNEFLQRFMLNYMLCRVTLDLYFKEKLEEENRPNHKDYLPEAYPELPGITDESSTEYKFFSDIVTHFLSVLNQQ